MTPPFLKLCCALIVCGTALAPAEDSDPKIKILYSATISESVPDAVLPMGLVRAKDGTLIAAFCDGWDIKPGTKTYLTRSTNLGRTWSEPYMILKSDEPHVGIGAGLAALPDGNLLLIETVNSHVSKDRSWEAVFKGRSSRVLLKKSTDDGKTFEDAGELPLPEGSLCGTMGTVVSLPNGDVILPAYIRPGKDGKKDGWDYGSGFFRSRDGGKSWGKFEVAFKDPPEGRVNPVHFNEVAYLVRPDNAIVAYSRIDSEKYDDKLWQTQGNNLWKTESRDNGMTWSNPVEQSIGGLFPALGRFQEGPFVLVCGNRHEQPTRKVCLYLSDTGSDFRFSSYAPYARTKGICYGSGTGGSQCVLPISADTAYVVYYATDPSLKSQHNTYIEGFLMKAAK
jgi:hypothetical protein